jgi:hypothetical protein
MEHPGTPRPVRLAHRLMENGQGRFLPMLSSAVAQEILVSGYQPATLELVYENRTHGGVVGRIADRLVLDLPIHEAMRERLEATAGEICAAATLMLRAGAPEVRALFAPCALGAEIVAAARRLREQQPDMLSRFRVWGVDPDRGNDLLPQAGRRATAAGVTAELIREDLRRHREVLAVSERVGGFHVISCVGLTQHHNAQEIAALVRFYASLLLPGGTLLLDRWHSVECTSRVADGLGQMLQYVPASQIHRCITEAGLEIEREHPTGEGGCVLAVGRKPGA